VLEGGAGILCGPDYFFSLQAPPGWVIDNQAGVKQGVDAVFYPIGSSWERSSVVCYGNARRITAEEKTPEQMARADIAEFHANGSAQYEGHFKETIELPESRVAQIWEFQKDKGGNFEAIAYISEKKTINFIVLHANSQKDFAQAWPSFQKLVLSYQFMGDHVTMENKASSSEQAPLKKP
jgi:hypothetical protein